ncbi:hypothetical protein C900_02272 [Fulvivirga imtechensis AK7]|uniref:Uncharacterized protein n=1 Tax=Fulvivirga imtechensis AK7 TaxID=1237149 RepID=L8JWV4_9BACT|nr:hypothetical protein [Fulvivirga imtechensis]ELR71687.1 hypothetical protein C900_02272 [Fulvivirga imtechensis AK7]
MDQLIQTLLRELTMHDPAAAARLRNIITQNMTPLALLRALYELLTSGVIDRNMLMRLLRLYARAGVIDSELLAVAVAEAEADAAAAAGASAGKGTSWLKWGARGGVYLILIYLLGAAIIDATTDLEHGNTGNGVCAANATPENVDADVSSYGPKSALRNALKDIQSKCENSSVNCTDPECHSCGKDAAVQTTEIKNRILWYTAVVTAKCQCWCK